MSRIRTSKSLPDIPIPGGDVLTPRRKLAVEWGISDKTASRMNLPTTYVGNTAYVPRDASVKILAAGIEPKEPAPQTSSFNEAAAVLCGAGNRPVIIQAGS